MTTRLKRRQGDSTDPDAPATVGSCFRCRRQIRSDQPVYDPSKLGLSVQLFGSDTFDSIDCLYSSTVDVSGGADNCLGTLLRAAISRTYPNHPSIRYVPRPIVNVEPIPASFEEAPLPRYSLRADGKGTAEWTCESPSPEEWSQT